MLQSPLDPEGAEQPKVLVRSLSAWFGSTRVLRAVSFGIAAHQATAIVGPSGCGKSTFVRCLNRTHELAAGARVEGEIRIDGLEVYSAQTDPVLLRRRVGTVFRRPSPFPTMSVQQNVLAGLALTHSMSLVDPEQAVETALRQAALWDEVKDHLDAPGISLSLGQQQRLCIARALALNPEVLLMDEPCGALDPIATARIEDLIHSLKQSCTIVLVTHSMQQAARVSDRTAFFLSGDLIEFDATDRVLTSPKDPRTEDYITGKFE